MARFFYLLILFALLFICPFRNADATPVAVGDSGFVVMNLAAHPDDEDGATLATYAKLRHAKAYSVFYTRGEGGQNEIGAELYDELGNLREKETREASLIQGSEPVFLGFNDFGFSKTAKETFQVWGGKDAVLKRIVFEIRALRPDVIFTNHDTVTVSPGRQHGHHQAVGITAFEAFEKAADSSYAPEQFRMGVGPWQVKKLFYRRFRPATGEQLVSIDASAKDAGGRTIEEIALDALAKHRSQGMDRINRATIPAVFRQRNYILTRSDKIYPKSETDFLAGLTPEVRTPLKTNENMYAADASLRTPPTVAKANPALVKVSPQAFIGLVKTYDNTLEETLQSYGVKFALIDSAMLASGDLSKYSAIVLDLRAYLYRTDLVKYNSRVLDYIKQGGHVTASYHKPGEWKPEYAPYPIAITGERVTEETAAVKVLSPKHRLMTTPNQIRPEDWNGWVQERSIYLPAADTLRTSPMYERLLTMSDESESQPATSLLWARYGKGTYTYISLALYRQLKIYNVGALKLFFNCLSQRDENRRK
ncbi:MAG: PIG-L family deacetylase [Rhizobacter sp.]|nr:PIG-L family deacetylase [Chlorobiales bacterium]